MNTLLKLVVIGLALMMVAYLIQGYANSMYHSVAFTAPVIGAVSYAGCILGALAVLMIAKLNWGK